MIDASFESRRLFQRGASDLLRELEAALAAPDCGPDAARHVRTAISRVRSVTGEAEPRGSSKTPPAPRVRRPKARV